MILIIHILKSLYPTRIHNININSENKSLNVHTYMYCLTTKDNATAEFSFYLYFEKHSSTRLFVWTILGINNREKK